MSIPWVLRLAQPAHGAGRLTSSEGVAAQVDFYRSVDPAPTPGCPKISTVSWAARTPRRMSGRFS